MVECYDVLYTYLMGDSRKNELYFSKHMPFFETSAKHNVNVQKVRIRRRRRRRR